MRSDIKLGIRAFKESQSLRILVQPLWTIVSRVCASCQDHSDVNVDVGKSAELYKPGGAIPCQAYRTYFGSGT